MRVAHLILALLLLVLFPTHAFADPVTAAIAAVGKAIAGFAASSALGSFLVGIGKSLVVGLLQQALGKLTQKKPKKQEPVGVVLETQTGDDLPLSFVVGSRGTAGKLKYWGTWGHEGETPNAYYVGVFEVGSLPSYAGPRGLSSLWVGTEFASVLWEEQVEGRSRRADRRISVCRHGLLLGEVSGRQPDDGRRLSAGKVWLA